MGIYPLVNIQKTMKHHNFQWVNPRFRLGHLPEGNISQCFEPWRIIPPDPSPDRGGYFRRPRPPGSADSSHVRRARGRQCAHVARRAVDFVQWSFGRNDGIWAWKNGVKMVIEASTMAEIWGFHQSKWDMIDLVWYQSLDRPWMDSFICKLIYR